uniref:Thioredoxin domain-containing protein 17 n=1 Tax=Cynoglossus semilaevis TaxID=244447 RepID=A0A3P8VZJ3_CYNSE
MSQFEEVNVHGYEEFCQAIAERKGKDIFVYFSGNKDAEGKSWCPDCVKAEPVVRGEMSNLPDGSVFIYCQVGERTYWKNPNNDFKKNLKLTGVPTLMRYGTVRKNCRLTLSSTFLNGLFIFVYISLCVSLRSWWRRSVSKATL